MTLDGMILAHAGGLDELAMLLFPIIVGGGVYLMTRQPKKPKTDPDPDAAEVRSIRERRQPPEPRQRWGGNRTP